MPQVRGMEGLRRLEKALGEQKGCIQRAWNDAMVSIKNELAFMEMDTLVMIAKEAVESSEPRHNSSEAQDPAPVALDTRGQKKQLQRMQLENQRLIGLLNHEACEMVHKQDT